MTSGIVSLREPGTITGGGFSEEELCFIVDKAAERGLGVMAHANGEPAILACAVAGVRSIEHGFFMTAQAIAALAEKSIFWVPTVNALDRAAKRANAPETARSFVADLIRSHLCMIRHAWSAGVPLAIGTDCVLPDRHYRAAYERELRCFEDAGIPHDEVIKIACEGGAELLGITV